MLRPTCLLFTTLVFTSSAWSAPKLVRAETLEVLQVPITHSAPAEVVSLNNTEISAQITAQITAIKATVGAVVEPGATVVELDCRDFQLADQRARANLDAARARLVWAGQQLQRARQLAQSKNVARDVVDQRSSELSAAEAEVRARTVDAQDTALDIERCLIDSPFHAAILERKANVGELANPGTPLLVLQDLEHIEVSAQVLPRELAALGAGIDIALDYDGGRYPLALLRVSPVINAITRSHEVRLGFNTRSAPAGASGRLVWTAAAAGMPAHLVVRRDERLGVFLLKNDKARFHPLAGAREGLPVVTDLPPSTLLITEGRHSLNDGDAVKAVR